MKSFFPFLLLLALASCTNLEHRTRGDLVGHWSYVDENQRCDYWFKEDGLFTGQVILKAKVVSKFNGRWSARQGAIFYTYLGDVYGRIPAGATDRDQLLEVTADSFLIRAANGDQRRYHRVE